MYVYLTVDTHAFCWFCFFRKLEKMGPTHIYTFLIKIRFSFHTGVERAFFVRVKQARVSIRRGSHILPRQQLRQLFNRRFAKFPDEAALLLSSSISYKLVPKVTESRPRPRVNQPPCLLAPRVMGSRGSRPFMDFGSA